MTPQKFYALWRPQYFLLHNFWGKWQGVRWRGHTGILGNGRGCAVKGLKAVKKSMLPACTALFLSTIYLLLLGKERRKSYVPPVFQILPWLSSMVAMHLVRAQQVAWSKMGRFLFFYICKNNFVFKTVAHCKWTNEGLLGDTLIYMMHSLLP